MNLLELQDTSLVEKTSLSRKLTLGGITKAYPVYRVRLDLLYYNDQNDRIATWITQYKSDPQNAAFDTLDREQYNKTIEGFIIASNPAAMETGCGKLRVDVKGLRYENRSQRLERMAVGDSVTIARDQDNPYNPNNFEVLDPWGDSLGTLPAVLCNAMAPIYDSGILHLRAASVSYMERLRERSRYAKQGVLFIEIVFEIHKQIKTPNPN